MKKRVLSVLILSLITLASALVLTACGGDNEKTECTHDYISQVTAEPTCEEKGEKKYACLLCGDNYTEELPANGHTELALSALAPTCTESGLTEGKNCSTCGKVLTAQTTVEALGHDEVSHEAKAPTCTEIGFDAYVACTRCDYTTYVEKAALGHDEVSHEAKAPTCTEIGWDTYVTCTRCDYTTYVEKAALGHDEVSHEAKAPTCTEIGWDTYVTCTRCEYTTYVKKAALGHTEKNLPQKAATCTSTGLTAGVACSVCDAVFTPQNVIPKLPHTYDDKYDESCNSCGFIRDAECKHSETEIIPGYAATCTQKGLTDGERCKKCEEITVQQEVIPELGHDEVTHEAKAPTCTEIGWDAYVTCTRCDYTTYAEKAALGHNEVSHEAKAPTCTEIGWDAYVTCTRCDYTTYAEKTPLGHNYSTKLSYDSIHHYYECHCGAKNEEETHKSSGAATATNDEVCTVCGYVIRQAVGISFKTLTVNGKNVYGTVANSISEFSFTEEIATVGDAKYVVSLDIYGIQTVATKTIPLTAGDNTVYVTELIDGEPNAVYTVTIRRKAICTASFNTLGGNSVHSVSVEEGTVILSPAAPTRAGYTFIGWDYDFEAPIIKDTVINAIWQANEDTPYRVEYYLENLEDSGYTLHLTEEFVGTTDTTATAEQKAFEHFKYNASKSVMSGNINGDGSQILKVYYRRNTYTVSRNINGTVTSTGTYKYGAEPNLTATACLGCYFVGWFDGENSISSETEYSFKVDRNIEARYGVLAEMSNFNFTSTETKCSITGIKDKTVTEITVPDYVTSISNGAFSGCSSLKSITIPFVGATKGGTSNTHFGYIFGASSYSDNNDYVPTSLKTVVITGESRIDTSAFRDCTSLTSITIPSSVTSIGSGAFSGCTRLTSIEVDANNQYYTDIDGNLYFKGGKTLIQYAIGRTDTSFVIPDSVTNIVSSAFKDCTSLTSITIPNSVTSIGDGAFEDCTGLTSITIPFVGATKDGTSNTHFGYIFGASSYWDNSDYVPTSLKTVIITGGSSIDNSAFGYCTGLTSITIPDSVTSIGYRAFYECTGLTSITIPDSVTSIGYVAFKGCTGLTSITIPFVGATKDGTSSTHFGYIFGADNCWGDSDYVPTSLKTVIVTGGSSIDYFAFAYCKGLKSITIPDSVTSISNYAFEYCTSLTSITIPDSVTSIGASAFYGCTNLVYNEYDNAYYLGNSSNPYVVLMKAKDTSITSCKIHEDTKFIYSSAFYYCWGLKSITIPDSVTSIGSYAFEDCTRLTSVVIGNGVESIGDDAFCNCTGLTSITIPDSVTSIGWYAFSGCTGLTSITIPDSVTSIGSYAFSDCTGLIYNEYDNAHYLGNSSNPYLVLVKAKSTSITSCKIHEDTKVIYSYAFYGCTGLTSVEIGNSVTSIGDGAFYSCYGLTSITIPDSVTSIGNCAFMDCTGLTSVVIGNGVESIGSYAFSGCTGLMSIKVDTNNRYYKDIDGNLYSKDGKTLIQYAIGKTDASFVIPDSVTNIGSSAFKDCTGLTSVVIGNGVKSIDIYAFSDCTGLTSITIPDSVTSIGDCAFQNCTGLTSITIPDSVTSIGDCAFYNCRGLTSIKYRGTEEQWEAISKGSDWNYNTGNYTITYNYRGM